jgi:hypothetical protein
MRFPILEITPVEHEWMYLTLAFDVCASLLGPQRSTFATVRQLLPA